MNTTKWREILNLYYENDGIMRHYEDKGDKAERNKYSMMNYSIQDTMRIVTGNDVWILVTKQYSRDDEITVVRVYKDNTMEDEKLAINFYPAIGLLEQLQEI